MKGKREILKERKMKEGRRLRERQREERRARARARERGKGEGRCTAEVDLDDRKHCDVRDVMSPFGRSRRDMLPHRLVDGSGSLSKSTASGVRHCAAHHVKCLHNCIQFLLQEHRVRDQAHCSMISTSV